MKTNLQKIAVLFCAVAVVVLLSGCATVSKGFSNKSQVMLNITPAGADLAVDGRSVGPSPTMVSLSPSDHLITASCPGYQDLAIRTKSSITTGGQVAMVANAAGIICPPTLILTYGTDFLTGAYKSHPPVINASMVPLPCAAPIQQTPVPAPAAPVITPTPATSAQPVAQAGNRPARRQKAYEPKNTSSTTVDIEIRNGYRSSTTTHCSSYEDERDKGYKYYETSWGGYYVPN